jgi:hypothetical protein
MTDPLIGRDALEAALYASKGPVVDAVLAYLRSVLTPEALECFLGNETIPVFSTGTDLHRRIFGEV